MRRGRGLSAVVIAFAVGTSAIAAVASSPSIAFAQTGDPAAAQALFDEGQTLMKQRKFAEACAKFQSSHRIDPRPGTVLNLANCYEENGQTASAWARYVEASELAARENQRDRERYARDHAKALMPKLAHLAVKSNGLPAGAVVKRDGVVLDVAALGTAVPVDPGEHAVEVEISGKTAWSKRVKVAPTTDAEVEVPGAKDPVWAAAAPPLAEKPVTTEAPSTVKVEADTGSPDTRKAWPTQKTLALVAAGVGVVGLGVGTFLGLSAGSKWSDAKDKCQPNGCPRESIDMGSDAKSQANIATVAFIVGGVALAGAGVLWFSAPSGRSASVGLAPMGDVRTGSAGLMAHGHF